MPSFDLPVEQVDWNDLRRLQVVAEGCDGLSDLGEPRRKPLKPCLLWTKIAFGRFS